MDGGAAAVSFSATLPKSKTGQASPSPHLAIGILYLAVVCGLSWLGPRYPEAFPGVPPWNPRPAIGLALLLLGGRRWLPWLGLGAVATAFLPGPGPWFLAPLAAGAEVLCYGAAAWTSKRWLGIDPDLGGFDDVFRFIGIVAAAAAATALCQGGLWVVLQIVPPASIPRSLVHYWIADMVGGLVVGPFLLANRSNWHHPGRLRAVVSLECLVLALFIGTILWVIFPRTVGSRFYPMFIPLVWIAARYGLAGVASALLPIQAVFVGCISLLGLTSNQIVKLQILMLSLAATGLLLGAVITERERARRSVIQGEARLKAIIDMAPDGMALIDPEDRVEMVNRQFELLAGRPAADILGQPLSLLVGAPANAAVGDERILKQAGGREIPVETSVSPIGPGERQSRVLSVRDISARRRAALRLGQRRAELESASRSNLSGELAAALAHELNQPLAAVITYTGACQRTLAGTEIPDRAREQLAKAVAQAERAGHVLSRLREFFRNSSVEQEIVAVTDLVRDMLLLLADEAVRFGVRFTLAIPDGLTARIDRLQIEQVLINLLRNSMEAMNGAGGEHVVHIEAAADSHGMIQISVADNGPGIAREAAEHLFRPFNTTRSNGMGLGLSISRSLIEANGGCLWLVEGDKGPGARLQFTIPAAGL